MDNPELIENIYDRSEGKKKEQDYARDYAITLNLGADQGIYSISIKPKFEIVFTQKKLFYGKKLQ